VYNFNWLGIEKAERNLLPILNNLFENPEINLGNGRFLVAPDRYDKLVAIARQTDDVQMSKLKLLRVHQDFRFMAIGLPVPKYEGNPFDSSKDPHVKLKIQITRNKTITAISFGQ
jgi:hypothetical protein